METLKQAFEEEYGKIETWSDEIVEAYKLALAMCLSDAFRGNVEDLPMVREWPKVSE